LSIFRHFDTLTALESLGRVGTPWRDFFAGIFSTTEAVSPWCAAHGGEQVLAAASGEQPLAFSNVESLLVAFLGGRSELAGIPVVLRLPPNYDGLARTVVITRVGGEFTTDDYLDRALMRVDTYGPDKGVALDLAGAVRSLIWLLPGTRQAGGAIISDVAETRGPSWLRDPGFATANRYTTRYQVLVRVGPRA
jgi:hypothetical protein